MDSDLRTIRFRGVNGMANVSFPDGAKMQYVGGFVMFTKASGSNELFNVPNFKPFEKRSDNDALDGVRA